jgi:homoserine O-acetyltransferase
MRYHFAIRSFSGLPAWIALLTVCVGTIAAAAAAEYPPPKEGDYAIKDFKFADGQTLPELKMHYRTWGEPQRDANGHVKNAVLIMHGTTGTGKQFDINDFAGVLFCKGGLLDAEKFYIISPDDIGHGQSSKPSDSLHAKFPNYGYHDMVKAEHDLLSEGLKVDHARLVMGTSMGGMHTWMWGELYPDFMDALMPLASLPGPISGRNRMWRKMISDAIRSDPTWENGDYKEPPKSMLVVSEIMFFMSLNPLQRYQQAPTGEASDKLLEKNFGTFVKTHDANDVLYALEASRDYDPAPVLESIKAPLVAINSADDLINPPELGILEREIKRVKNGKAIVIPESSETRGHGTHTRPVVWKDYLEALLKATEH